MFQEKCVGYSLMDVIFLEGIFRWVGCERKKLKSGVGLVELDVGAGYGGAGYSLEGAFGDCDE